MYSVNNLSVHFTGTYIFDDVSFLVNSRDRIGLVGRNGAGKTSLLRIMARLLEPKKGVVVIPQGHTVGYLAQELETQSTTTVLAEAMKAFHEAITLEQRLHRLGHEMATRTDYETADYMKLITRLNEANDRFHLVGGQTREADTEKVLLGLGFKREDFHRPMKEFSSGWQMRVELAKILLQRPNLLLLDEPTNHLDIESIQWLEEFLEDYPGALILVSHDRAFLDNITTRTIEISLGRIYDFASSYSGYVQMREEQLQQQAAAYSNQQRQITQVERFIERFRYKSTKARQVQSRIRLIEKMEKVEIEDTDKSSIRVKFPPAPRSGKVVVEGHAMSKSYGKHLVLKNLDFAILRNDAVAFVGRNGEGKTTLSKIIVGELEYQGEVKAGHNTHIGYFPQNQAELMDGEKTVFQTIDDAATGAMRTQVRNLLGSFLFGSDDVDKKVKVLSGGEKARLALARLLLKPVNLLVLDEPTNHLDMLSKDILKNALLQYTGTMIIVSHDRDFLQGLTNKVIEFKNQGIREYLGDVYDFLQARKLESLNALEQASSTPKTKEPERQTSDSKLQWEDRKIREKQLRKMRNQIEKTEEQISILEKEIAGMDAMLADPQRYLEVLNDAKSYKHYNNLKSQLEKEMRCWEELLGDLENSP
ncbi:MAG: ABC-F family ATP-binding cassette domain-containing protein [Bacteroidales bacterium]|nr:ABC-F family ATP-binding cassette domain-containing protein [Bacteroidales bacterium]